MDANTTLRLQWVLLLFLLGYVLYLLAPVLTPFVVAALLAWLFDPLVTRLQRHRMSRVVAVSIVFLVLTLALVALVLVAVPLLERQVAYLMDQIPKIGEWLRDDALPFIERRTGVELVGYVDPDRIGGLVREHWAAAGGIAATVVGGLSRSGMAILAALFMLLLIPVVTFYLLRDWPLLIASIRGLLPRPVEPKVVQLARESDHMLGGFLRGQMLVMLGQGLIYSVGLWLVGIELAFLIGMGAGLVSFVPYLGAIVGIAAAVIAALVQYGDLWHVGLVLLVFAVGQTVESVALTPWLVGDRIGMHPVAVIFAVLVGGQLFGFLGVLLALPVAAVLMVLLRYANERYRDSRMYAGEAVLLTRPDLGGGAESSDRGP